LRCGRSVASERSSAMHARQRARRGTRIWRVSGCVARSSTCRHSTFACMKRAEAC